MDLARDLRDVWYELAFFWIWGLPWSQRFGQTHKLRRTLKNEAELRALAEVMEALRHMTNGGFVEAVIRMLILLAQSRGDVRRDRLERSVQVLTESEPFRSLGAERRKKIIDQQTLLVQFEPEQAIETLPRLLKTSDERELAAQVVQFVPGAIAEMAPQTLAILQRFRRILGLSVMTTDVLENPLVGRKLAPNEQTAVTASGAAVAA
jgi:tellurite resistance protein